MDREQLWHSTVASKLYKKYWSACSITFLSHIFIRVIKEEGQSYMVMGPEFLVKVAISFPVAASVTTLRPPLVKFHNHFTLP